MKEYFRTLTWGLLIFLCLLPLVLKFKEWVGL